MGIQFDASSGYEVARAMRAGIKASALSLSSQELPADFEDLIKKGIEFNACSLNQLESFGKICPGGSCGLRFNPGKGSGGTGKTNVGGPSSSFGIWHELKDEAKAIVAKYGLKVLFYECPHISSVTQFIQSFCNTYIHFFKKSIHILYVITIHT